MSCYFCQNKNRKVTVLGGKRAKDFKYIYRSNVLHHIDCNRKNNSKSNLVELCELCHLRLHRKIYYRLVKSGKLKLINEKDAQ